VRFWQWRYAALIEHRDELLAAPAPEPTPEPVPEPVPEPAPELPEGWRLVRCDHTGYVPDHQIAPYWRAVHEGGEMTEPSQYADSAARLAWAAAQEREGGAA
jgi:hypothetical protein